MIRELLPHNFYASSNTGSIANYHSAAMDVNDAGVVVGNSQRIAGSAASATLWVDGVAMDLNALISGNNGWLLRSAEGINLGGDIVGFGSFGGFSRGFLLVPEVTADGGLFSNFATVTITVNNEPTFTSDPVTSATEDSAYSYGITTNDLDGDSLTLTAPTLPLWLTLIDNGDGTATLSGTPANGDVGDHNVVLEVSDGIGSAVQQSFTITVANVNDAPTFVSAPTTDAPEDVLYSYGIATEDVDAGATLTITATTLPAWLTLTDNGDGTATLSGTPANGDLGDHNVVLEVSDGIAPAVQQSFTITVANVNDAPVLDTSLNPVLATIAEDAVNPASTQVDALLAGAMTDPDANALQGIAVTAASNYHGVWQYSLDGGSSWGGMNEPSSSKALLLPGSALVRFLPKTNFNRTVKLWYVAWDQTAGTPGDTLSVADNTGGTKSLSTAWVNASLTVTPVNDAPVLDNTLSPTLPSIAEDTKFPAGTPVWSLIQGAMTDPDSGALRGIAVTAASTFHGVWQFKLSGVWQAMGAVSSGAALLLPGSALVRFIPNPDFHGTVKLWYRGWDQTEGTAGTTFNLAGKLGGTNAFSSAYESAAVVVTSVIDKPVIRLGGTLGYRRDAAAITLAPNAAVWDVDSPNFAGGQLRIWITDGTSTSNRLVIGAGFSVDANNNVLQGTTIIGKRTSNGFGTKELMISFNSNATPSTAQQLARAIAFKTVGGAAGQRTILFSLSDGDGGLSDVAMKKVNVT